jgi:hypothetical protein
MSKFTKMFGGSDGANDAWMHGDSRAKRIRRAKIASGTAGAMIIGAAVVLAAATNWTVGLTGGNGSAQSQTVSNLSITPVTTGSFTNQLYPGASGDIQVTITNPNAAPVAVTGVTTPSNSTVHAIGYSDQALTSTQASCTASTSLVDWAFSGSSAAAHTLATTLVVPANGSLTVTLTNMATMGSASPSACENTYFKMPALTAIAATAGAGTATISPATDSWSS